MNAVIYKYKCASCGASFEASGVPEMSYGEFILRTKSGEEAYVNAVSDPAFNELLSMVRSHPSLLEDDKAKSGTIAQRLFGLICDKSPNGQMYQIGMPPKCPNCSSHEMASWGELLPLKFSPVPMVTHNEWLLLDDKDKLITLNKALNDLL